MAASGTCSTRSRATSSSCRSGPTCRPARCAASCIYPATQSALRDERLLQILEEVQLPRPAARVGGLDAVQDWEKLLRRRAAAPGLRPLLAHAPKVAILDEATSALDSANEARLYQRLHQQGMTMISIAHRPAVLRYHQHVLLLKGEGEWELHPARGTASIEAWDARGNLLWAPVDAAWNAA